VQKCRSAEVQVQVHVEGEASDAGTGGDGESSSVLDFGWIEFGIGAILAALR